VGQTKSTSSACVGLLGTFYVAGRAEPNSHGDPAHPGIHTLTSRATHTHPTSPRRTGFCAIWWHFEEGARRPGPEGQVLRHVLWHALRNALRHALRCVLHVLVLHVSPKGKRVGGLASGSPRAAAYRFLPPERLRLFSRRGEAIRDDGGGAALHESVDGILHEVLRFGVQGRRGLVQQQHLGGRRGGGQLGAAHGCGYLKKKVVVVAAAAAAVVVRGGKLALIPSRRGHLVTEPTSALLNRTQETPDVDIPVRPPRTGVNTASGVQGLGVEEVVVLGVRIGVATRTRGAGGE